MKKIAELFLIYSFLIISLNCSFQTSIFNEMNKLAKGKNMIMSPLSIFQVLSLTTNGARGTTQEEMLETLQSLNIDELNEINYEILKVFKNFTTVEIANAVMTRVSALPEFSETAKKYLAPLETLKSADQVNGWCSTKTHGKISKIIDSLSDDIKMVLLNAIYFKGRWQNKFEERSTMKKPFYNLGTQEIQVDTMNKLERLRYYEDLNVQAVSLPYKDDGMSAIVILPREGVEINNFISKMKKESLSTIIKGFESCKVRLELPKFELKFELELNQVLKNAGMFEAFTNDANFSGLTEEMKLKIDQVIHKAFIKVDEVGTEAAAVTYVGMIRVTSVGPDLPEKIYEMKVNRPFLFLLKNDKLPEDYNLLFISKIEKLS